MKKHKWSRYISLSALVLLVACKQDFSPSSAKVFKYDGSVQCESTGVALDVMAQDLIGAGIDVICSQKGHDGLARITACGADTGNINIYEIHKSNVSDAKNLGFKSIRELSEYRDSECR